MCGLFSFGTTYEGGSRRLDCRWAATEARCEAFFALAAYPFSDLEVEVVEAKIEV